MYAPVHPRCTLQVCPSMRRAPRNSSYFSCLFFPLIHKSRPTFPRFDWLPRVLIKNGGRNESAGLLIKRAPQVSGKKFKSLQEYPFEEYLLGKRARKREREKKKGDGFPSESHARPPPIRTMIACRIVLGCWASKDNLTI